MFEGRSLAGRSRGSAFQRPCGAELNRNESWPQTAPKQQPRGDRGRSPAQSGKLPSGVSVPGVGGWVGCGVRSPRSPRLPLRTRSPLPLRPRGAVPCGGARGSGSPAQPCRGEVLPPSPPRRGRRQDPAASRRWIRLLPPPALGPAVRGAM